MPKNVFNLLTTTHFKQALCPFFVQKSYLQSQTGLESSTQSPTCSRNKDRSRHRTDNMPKRLSICASNNNSSKTRRPSPTLTNMQDPLSHVLLYSMHQTRPRMFQSLHALAVHARATNVLRCARMSRANQYSTAFLKLNVFRCRLSPIGNSRVQSNDRVPYV